MLSVPTVLVIALLESGGLPHPALVLASYHATCAWLQAFIQGPLQQNIEQNYDQMMGASPGDFTIEEKYPDERERHHRNGDK